MPRVGRAAGQVGAALALACGALALAGAARAAGPDSIVGYGPFQFGMSVAEAMKAVPRGRLMRCAFPDHFQNCVEYDDKAFGLPATVRARFGTDQKLDGVFVQIDQLGAAPGSQACRNAATAALKRLRDEYGPAWQPKGYAADLLRLRGDAKTAPTGNAKPDAKAKPQETAKTAAGKPGAANDGKGTAAAAAPARNDAETARQDLFVWFGSKSGKIGLVDQCRGDDTGVVYVIFTPSSAPGRKAS
ncbi:MAG TPA: hypothetical protein VMV26_10750 [Alphaproteobacteria bacterium]|nr:hypothetical protein [Alphaproteobacteria bacterium]